MKTMPTIIAILFSLCLSTVVFAQEKEDVTKYDFDDDVVQGDLLVPEGTIVPGRSGERSTSLIKVRGHFVPEMLKSVERI
ncbi:MAG: hypothetical protein JXR76_25230 [Deltaproteobacteria bacterium]|nr:hypothetical protein [Deltaproteobacteria bacterium]